MTSYLDYARDNPERIDPHARILLRIFEIFEAVCEQSTSVIFMTLALLLIGFFFIDHLYLFLMVLIGINVLWVATGVIGAATAEKLLEAHLARHGVVGGTYR